MKKLYEESSVQDIADAIREKNGGTEKYKVAQMAAAVRGIASGGAEVFYIDLAGDYPNYTCPVALADIHAAYEAGKVLECRCTMGTYTATLPLFIPIPEAGQWIFSGSGELADMGFPAQTFTVAVTFAGVQASNAKLATTEDKLPNPNALTITSGSNSVTYDGSTAKSIYIPTALPNPSALTVKVGSTTTTYDGSEAKTIEIADAGELVTETTEILPAYTNQIPLSTDVSGEILNGVGYEGGQLGMDGSVAAGTSFVSGFIPVKKGDVIRVKDPSSTNFSTGLVFALYNSSKATGSNIGRYINTMQGSASYGAVSISGNVLTWDTSNVNYYFWNNFAYLRVTTNSAASTVTVNEEIVETTQKVMTLKPTVKVGKENLNFAVSEPPLAGRKIVVFGDSLIGMTRDQTSVPAYAAAYTGAEVYNVGFGGCRMAKHPSNGYAAFSMWALADAVATGNYSTQDAQAPSGSDYFASQLDVLKSIDFTSVDAIVVHYGTNDFAANVPVDDPENLTSTDTVCGALRYSVQKILSAYPKIRIFLSLPIYRMWESVGAESYKNGLGKTLPEYDTAMQTAAEAYNLPIIDGYKRLGINALNDSAFSTDGTHLNDWGRRQFGELIGGYLICGA